MSAAPTVAIVGRPNVGKSTLFNRITRGRRAIVHPAPGVTRDVQRGEAEWTGVDFQILDTGGLFSGVDDDLISQVEQRAIDEAMQSDVMLFVTDGKAGMVPGDFDVAERIRGANIPVVLVVNKTEKLENEYGASEFYKLGFDNIYPVSALHGEGIGDVLDDVVALLPRHGTRSIQPDLKLAVIGMPNVGKSSLVNAIVGEHKNIVDSRPGTTRDSIDIMVRWHGRDVTLVDTAGIKRKARTHDGITAISSLKSIEMIQRCDVALLMMDASRKISNQDVKVASYIHKAGKGVVVCFNKWDLVEKEDKTYREFEKDFKDRFGFMSYAPSLFISALTHQRVGSVIELAWSIKEKREHRIPTSEFNQFVGTLVGRRPPPFYGGGNGKIYYGTQVDIAPPTFALFVNKRRYFGRNYLRFLNNQVREAYDYAGTIIRINMIEKRRREVPT